MLQMLKNVGNFLKPFERISSFKSNHNKISCRSFGIIDRSTFMYVNVVPEDKIDWSEKLSIKVRNQRSDGNCFLYSSLPSMECALLIKRGVYATISPTLGVVANPYLIRGCGATPLRVLHFYYRMGYLFGGALAGLKKDCEMLSTIDGYAIVPPLNVHAMEQAVSQQPIIAVIDSTNLEFYNPVAKEIIDYDEPNNQNCLMKSADHCVLIVGYGETNGVKWWKCLNSWGISYGDNGYFKIVRGSNIRGIEQCCYFPIVYKPRLLNISCYTRGKSYEILRSCHDLCIKIVVICNDTSPGNKIELYSSLAGVTTSYCLPVSLDMSMSVLKDEEFSLLCNNLMDAIKETWGQAVLIHFEGFPNGRGYELYSKYNDTHAVFIDNIHGLACLVVAGILASENLNDIPLVNHKYMIYGSMKDVFMIAALIRLRFGDGVDLLIVDDATDKVLVDEIKTFKPTVLVGLSLPFCFDKEVVQTFCSFSKNPIILAMGATTTECNLFDAFSWSDDNVIFASRFIDKTELVDECAVITYIYPGIGLGMFISGAVHVHNLMLVAAAEALASHVTEYDLVVRRKIYPSWFYMRDVSASIAAAVALSAYELGLATKFPRPDNLHGLALEYIHKDVYP